MFRRDLIKAIGAAPFLSVGDLLKTPDYTVWEFNIVGNMNCINFIILTLKYNNTSEQSWMIPLEKRTKKKSHRFRKECEKSMLDAGYKRMICINLKNQDRENCFYIDYNIVNLNTSGLFNPIIRDEYVTL